MDHQDVERLFWPRQLQINAVLTSFQLRVHNYLLCGSDRVKQTLEMYLIKPERPLHVFYSLMSWTV
jgi:hypothetical protein